MKKYRTFFKLQRRMISKTRSRFLSVLLITFIGTAFFAGLRITPTVMNTATDAYLDQQQYADLTLITTYGITAEDIAAIEKIDGVEKAEGIFYFDALLTHGDEQEGVTVYSESSYFNQPYLVEGRDISSDEECLIDLEYQKKYDLSIGDTILLENDQGSKTFTIVGVIKDVRYILYYKRGTNQYGSGASKGFVILSENGAQDLARNQDLVKLLDDDQFYNEVCIQVTGADQFNIFDDEYDAWVNLVETDIEEVMSSRLNQRYETLIADKKALLEEPLKAYEKGLAEYENGKKTFDIETKEAEIALIEGKMQVLNARRELLNAQSQITDGGIDVDGTISGIQGELNGLKDQLNDLKDQLNEIETSEPIEPETPEIPETPEMEESSIEQTIEGIRQLIDQINGEIDEMNTTLSDLGALADGLLQLESGKLALDKAELEIEVGEATLALRKQQAQEELDQAKQALDEAKEELDKAQAQIDEIPQGTYYLLDQNMNEGLASYKSDSERIGAIAEIFPLTFFLVAALVSLTTMTRMVEEQRSQSGTLRALGYSRGMVMMQYLVYALLATMIGAVLGILFGAYLFPAIIYGLYSLMMYDIPMSMIYCMNRSLFIESIAIAVVVTLVATFAACAKELMSVPAILMRPKTPKLGKRIILERIPMIWRHLNFNQKVTMRNIFRYKKRFLMSVVGIAGCAALMVTGFGVKYSLTDMTDRQFEEIWKYDGAITYSEEHHLDENDDLKEQIKSFNHVSETLLANQLNVSSSSDGDKTVVTNLVVPVSTKRLDNYFKITDVKTGEKIELEDNSAVITQKLSEMLDVKVGDTMHFTYQNITYDIVVGGIAENYIQHYIYMSPAYYTAVTQREYTINTAYFNVDELSDELENTLGKEMMAQDEIQSVSFTHTTGATIIQQMNSVNIIVWVLIISAGLLAFVVLYNLTNININERITEIATIKVLGFRDHEVDDYVFRENILLSMIGTVLGLFLGIFLHRYIMTTVEVDYVMFVRSVRPVSYLYASVLTMVFTLLINRFMRRVLRRVDMVSSLKSVE